MSPNEVMQELSCSFVHKRLFRAAKGFVTGGPIAAVGGFLAPTRTQRPVIMPQQSLVVQPARVLRRTLAAAIPAIPATPTRPASSPCWQYLAERSRWGWLCEAVETLMPRSIVNPAPCGPLQEMKHGACVDRTPFLETPAERSVGASTAVAGAFGMPAMVPFAESRTHLSCPPGMVLGRDDLCYPKQVLRRDSKFRKWRPGMRPILTGGERHGITKAKRSINKARAAVGLASLK